ncbi:hypothetical protein HY085_01090 [Candidatus Gottesmanbacteria bacterium]|nr:hypothetical protein [Candidatus Gottesmanbacteria bacterium]
MKITENKTEKIKEPSKMIIINGVLMTKDQAYKLWSKGQLAGPVKQQPTSSGWRSGN